MSVLQWPYESDEQSYADLVPQAFEVLERAMSGRSGYGSLDIIRKEMGRLRAIECLALALVDDWRDDGCGDPAFDRLRDALVRAVGEHDGGAS